MTQLNREDIEALLESLKYSIQRVADAPKTPPEVRDQNLQPLIVVQAKLRKMKDEAPA